MDAHDPQTQELASAATIDADEAAAQRKRRAARQRLAANMRRLVTASVATSATFVVILVILYAAGGDGEASDGQADAARDSAKDRDDSPGSQYFTEAQLERKKALEQKWQRVQGYDPTTRMKPLLERVASEMRQVASTWDKKDYDRAEKHMIAAEAAMEEAEQLRDKRISALELRTQTKVSAGEAEKVGAPNMAEELWEEGGQLAAQAQRHFDQDDFEQAVETWLASSRTYDEAKQQTLLRRAAEKAKADYAERLTKRFTLDQINAMGGPAWQQAAQLASAADQALIVKKYADAKDNFDQAKELVGDIEINVRRITGVHYWAINAGYTVGDILLRRAAGDPFDAEDRAALSNFVENLMLEPSVLAALPAGEEPPIGDLANVLRVQLRDALKATRGEAVAFSFDAGVQMRVIERLLREDREAMSTADKNALNNSLAFIRGHAEAANFPAAFHESLDEFVKLLAYRPEFAAIQKAREHWRRLIIKLRDQDDAMEFVAQGGV